MNRHIPPGAGGGVTRATKPRRSKSTPGSPTNAHPGRGPPRSASNKTATGNRFRTSPVRLDFIVFGTFHFCARQPAIAGLSLLLFFALSTQPAGAQSPRPELTEYQVKALYLLNFTRYVEWPDEAFDDENSPFVIGLAGADPFDDNLARLVRDRTVGGRAIEIRKASTPAEIRNCHLLFITASEGARLAEIVEHVGDQPVLTVGETPRFLQHGGQIGFTMHENNVRFEVDLPAVRRSNLRVHSQLLRVADAVKNE